MQGEAAVALEKDGALTAAIDEDDGLCAGTAGSCEDAGVDACELEGGVMQRRGGVVAQLANIACAQAPPLAGDDGSGGLSTGEDGHILKFDLAADGRKAATRMTVSVALRPTPTRSTDAALGMGLLYRGGGRAIFCLWVQGRRRASSSSSK